MSTKGDQASEIVEKYKVFEVPTLLHIEPESNCEKYHFFYGPYDNLEDPLKWMLLKAQGLHFKGDDEQPTTLVMASSAEQREERVLKAQPPNEETVQPIPHIEPVIQIQPVPQQQQQQQEEQPPHPSRNQVWYPDEYDQFDKMQNRVARGYDFNYPKDHLLDGYQIEQFNTLLNNFHKRQSKLLSLITHKLPDQIQNLTLTLVKEEPSQVKPQKVNNTILYFVSGFIVGAIVTSIFLIRTIKYFTTLSSKLSNKKSQKSDQLQKKQRKLVGEVVEVVIHSDDGDDDGQ